MNIEHYAALKFWNQMMANDWMRGFLERGARDDYYSTLQNYYPAFIDELEKHHREKAALFLQELARAIMEHNK